MKPQKQKLVLLTLKDDRVFFAHRTPQLDLELDVTPIFNFGMFIQKSLENPNDDEVQKYIDENFII